MVFGPIVFIASTMSCIVDLLDTNLTISIHDGPTSQHKARVRRTPGTTLLYEVSDDDYMRIHGAFSGHFDIKVAIASTTERAECNVLLVCIFTIY